MDELNKLVQSLDVRLIAELVAKQVAGIRNKFLASVNDKVTNLIPTFATDLQKAAVAHMHNWHVGQDQSVPVFPDGTIYYTKAENRLVLVVQQSPQVRSLNFVKTLWDVAHRDMDGRESYRGNYENYMRGRVSLPYVIFVLVFIDDGISGIHVVYSNTPITKLSDTVFNSNLPNVAPSKTQVCMGTDFSSVQSGLKYQPITTQVEATLSYFWGSVFNGDYTEHFLAMAKRDRKLESVQAWVDATKKDPLFVLKTNWIPCGTLENLINTAIGVDRSRGGLSVVLQNEAKHRIDKLVQELASSIVSSGECLDRNALVPEATVRAELVKKLESLVSESALMDAERLRAERESLRLAQQELEIQRRHKVAAGNRSPPGASGRYSDLTRLALRRNAANIGQNVSILPFFLNERYYIIIVCS